MQSFTVVQFCKSHRGDACSGEHILVVYDGFTPLPLGDMGKRLFPEFDPFEKGYTCPFHSEHVIAESTQEALALFKKWQHEGLSWEYLRNPSMRKRIRKDENRILYR